MEFGRKLDEPIFEGYSTRFEADCQEIDDLNEDVESWARKSKRKAIRNEDLGLDECDAEILGNEDTASDIEKDEVGGNKFEYNRFDYMGKSCPRARRPSNPGLEDGDVWPATLASGWEKNKARAEKQEPHQFFDLKSLKKAKMSQDAEILKNAKALSTALKEVL